MSANTRRYITVRVDKTRLFHSLTVLSVMLITLSVITLSIYDLLQSRERLKESPNQTTESTTIIEAEDKPSYPISASEINHNLLSLQIPPPALDALPYDVQEPLFNGTSVPVKKRWLWVPHGQQITLSQRSDGEYSMNIPIGTMLWKEFYIETDRVAGLIERRLLVRVETSQRNPQGWAFYTSHHRPTTFESETVIRIDSSSQDASNYVFQPDEWLPTQSIQEHLEIAFQDVRGVEYGFIFPGQIQCVACHGGAAGAYPNLDDDPIFAFALHPNNLTAESYNKLIEKGWMSDETRLLSNNSDTIQPISSPQIAFEIATRQLVGFMRNNCASCHNASPHANANMTSFILEPNRNYTPNELIDLFSINGVMMTNAHPLVTLGNLEQSELWLRLNGHEGRRRMPPSEGGLPNVDASIIQLFEEWIILAQNYKE
jgi:hypothetical protein